MEEIKMALLASNYTVDFVEALDDEGAPITFKRVYGLNVRLKTVWTKDKSGTLGNLPGDIEPIHVTLERGTGQGLKGLYSWLKAVRAGDVKKRTVIINLFSGPQRETPVVTWKVLRANPVALHAPEWDSEENSIAIEKVDLVAEDLEVEFA
jgi:phage tail-like protein